MFTRLLRSLGHTTLGVVALAASAAAQGAPNQPASNPACVRLESQLAAINSGSTDPTRADQVKRAEDAVAKQQADLDRTLAQAHKQGCEGQGFLSLFSSLVPQCGPINSKIQQMRGDLDRATTDLEQLKSGTGSQDSQRRALIGQLAQNNCGAQYTAAANEAGPSGFFDRLFGGGGGGAGGGTILTPGGDGLPAGTFQHGLRAHLRRLLFPDLVLDGVEPLRRRRALVPAAVPRGRSRALQLPQSGRGHGAGGVGRAASFIRRCRTPSTIARSSRRPARAASRGRAGATRSRTPTTPRRCKAATSSSPTRPRRRCRKRRSPSRSKARRLRPPLSRPPAQRHPQQHLLQQHLRRHRHPRSRRATPILRRKPCARSARRSCRGRNDQKSAAPAFAIAALLTRVRSGSGSAWPES